MLGDRKVFIAVGGAPGVMGLLSFVAVTIIKVVTSHPLDMYYTPRLGPVPFVAALGTLVVAVAAMTFAGALRLINWYRQRRTAASRDGDV
jgi:hypothetical protein